MAGTESPDLTPYVDLRIFDMNPQEVFETALQDLQTKNVGWVPREDNIEVMLMEAMALEVAESIFAINRLPNAIMVMLMKLYGITKDEGAPPTATVTVTVVNTFGYTLPAGTRFLLALSGGADPIVLSTTEALLIPNGSFSATVAVVGDRYTDQANGVASGTTVEIIDSITFVESVVTASTVVNGRAPETDLEWISRGSQRLSRLVDTLVVPAHFTAAALELSNVTRAVAVDLYDPGQAGVPGDHPGHVTLAVYGDGAPLSAGEKTAIQTDFELKAQANLVLHVIDPLITNVNVTVSVKIFPGYTFTNVQADVVAALDAYLAPETWPWSSTVRRNELIALISNVPGVDYVGTLTTPASDTGLTGVAPLANLGTATVTQV